MTSRPCTKLNRKGDIMRIKSVTGQIHDLGYGGYPYKIIVMVEVDVKEYSKLPVLRKAESSLYGKRTEAVRDLGSLVLEVNNAVYKLNNNIPAYNPFIDSNGGKRAKGGVKTLEFVYFMTDHVKAAALGFEQLVLKTGEVLPKSGQYVKIEVSNAA
jgi:hypothetical protein